MPIKLFYNLVFFVFIAGCSTLKIHNPASDENFTPPPQKKYDVILVLGGGGVKGIAHVGVLEVLEAHGIRPDLIIGCSAGAIVGAMYADYPSSKALYSIVMATQRGDLLSTDYLPVSRFGYSDHSPMSKYFNTHLYSKTFDTLRIPFMAVATDISTGKLMVLHDGDLHKAVMASSAFPGAYLPVNIRGKYMFDGGASDVIPVQVAKQFNSKLIIAVDISEGLPSTEPTNMLGLLRRAVEISYMHLSQHSLRDADVVIKMNFKDIGLFDDSRKQDLYETGKQKTLDVIAMIKRKMKQKGIALPRSLV